MAARKSRRNRQRRRRTQRRARIQRGRGYLGVPDVRSVPNAAIVPVAVGDLQDGSKAFSLLDERAKQQVDDEELRV